MIKKEINLNDLMLSIETGRLAKQADGAVLVRYGDVMVLVTAVAADTPRENIDFLPFTVDYREKAYAAGKIPGGFFKREGRPQEKEILTSRLIDRPLRPLFPDEYYYEVQVIATVLSADQQNDPDVVAVIGASSALLISKIPFTTPVGAVRVGRINGEFIINPSYKQIEESDVNIVVAGTKEAIMMVEGGANEISEKDMLDAILFGHEQIKKIIALQEEFASAANPQKSETIVIPDDPDLKVKVKELSLEKINRAVRIGRKQHREEALGKILEELLAIAGEDKQKGLLIKKYYHEAEREEMRRVILEEGIRADGRSVTDIRPITCEVGVLPRTHGSAVFTRGETQALVVTTLGTSQDEQRVDALEGESRKTFMLHYNFPAFSVGETASMRNPGRREIGHGNLAERSLLAVLPKDKFPYTIRIVSDILESNGSSSMATVCGATLSLMDAGVPIKDPVAGIAMGLIKEGEKVSILSDILGIEDHLGDMDFKVAGTKKGITAFQMDIKIFGVTKEIMEKSLEQARVGRIHILDEMEKAISKPRENLSVYAPRILTHYVRPDKIGEIIGPGGKMIRSIIEKTGAKIEIDDSGRVNISSVSEESANKALEIIKDISQEPEIGKIYFGKVKKIMDFGAFVEIFPKTEGLVHISQLADYRVNNVSDEVREGEEIAVKLIDIDEQGRLKLSRKEALKEGKKS
ncbi:MAG: polyribonucleotide nucleotidyltransferase [Candidatus Schekmanbacteria bacterium RIFCSPHIGHO2_02_FULL_38_11]|uniref:Polyribonucleotide nucleotidyltransferase n=1 Tax=Candidatus Schekmanbacteria bacterium RIFCSPLOWO2_12_FULL_38_15 TaxID=1817883 RepID=A0A1F7SJU6_9BACT|nr:MAG: polyribonucleotide nucleotidyltransferase [Candidatus Schekmanbacteria bacterium RIFCSPLOWO2_02_FULL_38_14]OGL53497.1 MAG: polyribonucleotide nucleotidyltransferase [Candidatus Schekmanbacteria bacterium RIFCSPLOWO2_12_FULL_38_15]OGL54456.1 MAG: polyribonucleotide nucleotidyltransferase [Candidatus Schekmanbacteria bacterium RIFCSPHIGHO2_02_FULL_38_11]